MARARDASAATADPGVVADRAARNALAAALLDDCGLARSVSSELQPGHATALGTGWLAVASGLCGDPARASRLAGVLQQSAPKSTLVTLGHLPAVEAALNLSAGDGDAAVAALERTRPVEWSPDFFLIPLYLRGRGLRETWKDADADLPIVRQAKAEYSKLKG